MAVSDNAVKAAQKAYRECEGDSTESHRAALTAALPFLSVQGAVKKMEWRKGRAETPFGPYHVIEEANDDEPFWFVMFNGKAAAKCGAHDDEESAIFAAQADYERRILSAIEAAPPLSKLKAENARLKDRLAEALKALGMMLREHDILSGNFGDVMDPKHRRPDRWPTAAEAARRVLEGGEANG